MAEKNIDFEKSLSMLEEIIHKLESGNCTLDESISLFEQGMKHMADCRTALGDAEKRIKDLEENGEKQ